MKTNQKWMYGLLLLGVLLGPEAQAFYNPSTGRWLSRDPIGEPGFTLLTSTQQARTATTSNEGLFTSKRANPRLNEENLYGFVLNVPQNRVDPLGLLTFEGCSTDQQQQIQNNWNSFCQQVKSSAFKCCLSHFNLPQRLATMCDRADTKIVCQASNTADCGWSLPFGRTIYLGQLGLTEDPGCGPLGCTLLHEMTHLAGHWPERWADRVENCLQGCPQRPTH
jgi:hypothetical protein